MRDLLRIVMRIDLGALSLGLVLLVSASCRPGRQHVEISRITSAGDGRYSVSATAEEARLDNGAEKNAYNAAVDRARRYCKARGGRRANIESSSGTSISRGKGMFETATDTQRIYFRCEKTKKAKRKQAKRKRSKSVAKQKAKNIAKQEAKEQARYGKPAGGAIGSVAVERWTDKATGLAMAKFRYTFDPGTVLSIVARTELGGTVSAQATISIVSESHSGYEFGDDSLLAIDVNGATVAALDTAWNVQHRPGRIVRETLEATLPIAVLVRAPVTGLTVRAGILEAELGGEVMARFQEFLATVKSGQLAIPVATPTISQAW